jgi:hypothetical protein
MLAERKAYEYLQRITKVATPTLIRLTFCYPPPAPIPVFVSQLFSR